MDKRFAWVFLYLDVTKKNQQGHTILSNDTFSWKDLQNKGYIVIKSLSSDFHKMSIYIGYMLISRIIYKKHFFHEVQRTLKQYFGRQFTSIKWKRQLLSLLRIYL